MTVRSERDGPVLVVTLDRPKVKNAVDGATASALAGIFADFDADAALSCAVLTGAGSTFCAGADLKELAGGAGTERLAPGGHAPMGPTWLEAGKPVIAAVEGHAVAGGLELALWCDLRVAATTATFGAFNRRFGVPLIDGATVRLPRLVGLGRALDLILSGRPVSGVEAHAIGLVDRLTEPGRALPEAIALARQLASFPQAGMRADLQSTRRAFDGDLTEALQAEFRRGVESLSGGEGVDGAKRFASGEGRHGTGA